MVVLKPQASIFVSVPLSRNLAKHLGPDFVQKPTSYFCVFALLPVCLPSQSSSRAQPEVQMTQAERRVDVIGEGCERSGHSIDCILALISIWLDPPPLQRSGTGAEVFQLGVHGGPPGANPLWWKQRGEGCVCVLC